jgi:hypothetical protein
VVYLLSIAERTGSAREHPCHIKIAVNIVNLTQLRNLVRSLFAPRTGSSVLVTDILFPSRYAMWRIAETTSFMEEKGADFLVFKVDSYEGIPFEVDFEEMVVGRGFKDYNILIFDPKYNFLNRHNTRIDGTRFNGLINASYLISKNEDFNVNNYRFVYHIFLMCYEAFNCNFLFPKDRQGIHLYPGGGNLGPDSVKKIDRRTKVVSTHPKTSRALRDLGHQNHIECLGGSFLTRNDAPFPAKGHNDGILRVAFASMGRSAEKGAREFTELAQGFSRLHPNSKVEFVSISREPLAEGIRHHQPMGLRELLEFYRTEIDVLVSMDTGLAFNGWPLGMEAALCGCVLATSDPQRVGEHYNFAPDSLFLFDIAELGQLVAFINQLDADRALLWERSLACQSVVREFLSYDNQQGKIFEFLNV